MKEYITEGGAPRSPREFGILVSQVELHGVNNLVALGMNLHAFVSLL